MPRFAGIPVNPQQSQQAASRPRFAGVPVDEAPITDLPAVYASIDPADDPRGFTPPRDVPSDGRSLLNVVRQYYPDWDDKRAARELASYYEKNGIPKTQFYLTSGLGKSLLGLSEADMTAPDPTEGMGFGARFAAGAGSALHSAGQGVKQLGTAIAREALGDRTGLTQGIAQAPLTASLDAQRAEIDESRRLDAPLMRTGAGLAGNVAGNIGMLVAPGGVLKMAAKAPALARGAGALDAAGSALLPSTVRGATGSGAALGAAQPAMTGGERVQNVLVGGGGGLVGAGAPRVAGAVNQWARNLSPAISSNMQARAAGEVLERFSSDPAAVRNALAGGGFEIVPGSMPTTAEATGDIGLAGLQRTLANMPEFSNPLTLQREGNNAARVAAIEGRFGGANAGAADTLTQSRDLAARQTLRPISNISIQDLTPLQNGVNRLIQKNQAAPAVRDALAAVQAEIPNIKTVQDAHAVRQYIGQLMTGLVDGKAGAKLARKELMTVQSLLDRQMAQAFPDWGKFLREYKGASREIGQVNVGEALLGKGPNMRAVGDIPQLSPAKFAGAANDLDRVSATATGFRRQTADKLLTPEQRQVVDEVRRDLERYARTETRGKAIGSNTMQNAVGGNRLQDAVGPVGAAIVEPISGVALLGLNALRKSYGERVVSIVHEAMLDPQRAAEILATLPSKQRREIVAKVGLILNQAGSVGGRSVAIPAKEQIAL